MTERFDSRRLAARARKAGYRLERLGFWDPHAEAVMRWSLVPGDYAEDAGHSRRCRDLAEVDLMLDRIEIERASREAGPAEGRAA